MAATDLYDNALELLDAAHAALADAPGGQIEMRYVSEGLPAFDCDEQLTVHAGGPSLAETLPTGPILQPGHRPEVGSVDLVAFTVTVIRCAPVMGEDLVAPTAAEHTTVAKETLGDVWAIWHHLKYAKKAGYLFAPEQREMFLDPCVALTVSGGVAGWEIPVRVQIDGYRPSTVVAPA